MMKYGKYKGIRQNPQEIQRNNSKPDGPHIYRSTGRPETKSQTGIPSEFVSNTCFQQKYEEIR